ncbi:hypothetical protein [Flavobacterium cucumis]|uniref:Uncharacterized protein n=2 Tax=Flavobacterium cucumis TaxID=416016 RepID=A0A1M7ZYL3_9FLAO|nr:hypothetical protein [Flavobacterium cucumis]SHO73972.1 hypothetical protein SAMN05443547_2351 [Flavobacterium cucumis]
MNLYIKFLVFLLSTNFIFAQKNIIKKMEYKILTEKEGLNLIKKEGFYTCKVNAEDNEHKYYNSASNGYLIYNKYIKDFILYRSIDDYKKMLDDVENQTVDISIDFNKFEEMIPLRLDNISNTMNIEISKSDSIECLKNLDSIMSKIDKSDIDFSNSFMDFFSYYYVAIKNEIEFNKTEIQLYDDKVNFYVFLKDSNERKEIFNNFYNMVINPDKEISFYLCAKEIVNPFIIKNGKKK